MDTIEATVEERIVKPVYEVFAAIVDHTKMAGYFITGASGPMRAGARVQWEFADVGCTVPIDVIEVEPNRRIVYESSHTGSTSRVEMTLDASTRTRRA